LTLPARPDLWAANLVGFPASVPLAEGILSCVPAEGSSATRDERTGSRVATD